MQGAWPEARPRRRRAATTRRCSSCGTLASTCTHAVAAPRCRPVRWRRWQSALRPSRAAARWAGPAGRRSPFRTPCGRRVVPARAPAAGPAVAATGRASAGGCLAGRAFGAGVRGVGGCGGAGIARARTGPPEGGAGAQPAGTHAAVTFPELLLARLGADPSVATYAVPLPVAPGQAPAWLVGATRNCCCARGAELLSHPLAGSARRSTNAAEDEQAAQALLASTKDHDEHRHVVEAIVDGLAPYCSHIDAQPRPALHATASMWHLGTRIHATLKDPQTSAAELLAQLHPTPAVCGTPRLAALQRIRELEPVPRGFYAGAVGWLDAQGDGDWYVATAAHACRNAAAPVRRRRHRCRLAARGRGGRDRCEVRCPAECVGCP